MAGGFKDFANTKDVKFCARRHAAARDAALQLQGRPQRRRQAVLSAVRRHGHRPVTRLATTTGELTHATHRAIVAAVLALLSRPMRRAGADRLRRAGAQYRAGWTFTPTFGVGETYDDNVSLFSTRARRTTTTCDGLPGRGPALLRQAHDRGHRLLGQLPQLPRRSRALEPLGSARAGSSVRQQQTARLTWFGHANAALLPTTDLIDLGGIPFRNTGARRSTGAAASSTCAPGQQLVTAR